MTEDLKDHIAETLEKVSANNKDLPLELFTDERYNKDGIAFKTDLVHKEHVLVSILMAENQNLIDEFGEDFNLFGNFLNEFRRHKVSLDRKSRQEFSQSIQRGISPNDINVASNIKNLAESRT